MDGAGEAARPDALPAADLEKRRAALASWTFEPVAIEGSTFLFHLDRRDGSFFLEDRRTRVKWFSSWGRRGFASVRLAAETGGDPGSAPWYPIDRIERVASEATRIRFRGLSSKADVPPIQLEVSALARGLSLRFDVPEEGRARGMSVRLLDSALWIPDTDPGGAALPVERGEWHESDSPGAMSRRLGGIGPGGSAGARVAGDGPMTLSFLGLLKSKNPLLVRWRDPGAALDVERRPVADPAFPGRQGIFVSLELSGASGAVELIPLGEEETGILDVTRAHRDLLGNTFFPSTLRHKTGARPELRSFLGAALFRLRVGEGRGFADAASFAERLRRTLGLDQAAVILEGWSPASPGGKRDLLPALASAGGDGGLADCARRIKALGYIFGLDLPADRFNSGDTSSGAAWWRAALALARSETAAPALLELCSPQLVVLSGAGRVARANAPGDAELPEARADFGRHLAETFGLAGIGPASEEDVGWSAFFDGPAGALLTRAPRLEALPLFDAAFGHCARISGGPGEAVRPDDAALVLAHLLVGEVPLYFVPDVSPPAAPRDGAGWCFARDEGWAEGKGLAPHEVFLKNTYEVLSFVARQKFRDPLVRHRKLTRDGSVRESNFGVDMRVLVNFGPGSYEDEEEGVVLPPFGFLVKHPYLFAFHALRVNDVEYDRPAFFVLRSLEGKMILRAEEVKVFHGFGPSRVRYGRDLDVEREAVLKIW
ncbi:MAG TPA: hypothetical protein VMT52_20495 [Planctomycetota bacterium]|nr:hypothetical protein [Planctomycetota bacterium]